jgi:hypothetical protein
VELLRYPDLRELPVDLLVTATFPPGGCSWDVSKKLHSAVA